MGMTRAKEKLFFTAADYYGEGKREKKLSPFIFEALGDKAVSSEQRLAGSEQLTFLDYEPQAKPTEALAKAGLHIDYLSYSQIETFNTCPLHYKLKYIYKVPTPPSSSQSFGISIHATLNEFYKNAKEGQKPTEKLVYEIFGRNWVDEGYTSKAHEKKFFEKGKVYLSGYLKYGFDPKVISVALEQPFTVPLQSLARRGAVLRPLKVGGKIDRVDVLPGGTIEIIDYKTGATIPTQREVDENLQLSFYALAATTIPTEPFGVKPEKIKLSLYFLDDQEKISTTRTAQQLKEATEEIFKVRDEIEKSDFKCSGHMFCQMGCEFSLFCRSD